ncbi:DUF4214 domain-containing protein [Conexibacter woesei]|uniref:DUF4214 domain-containing protein n=1 Tax=Conexibacter woesei (strain DSM 14684 / CCUG 47730 / CIP 108061 / JCM 11494 / NBRC 100937 / ID131577) TaxID=469383 RepID=D3FCX7_CONWI|nr:DUF4214 domain-containing protein [Conexibacter woesei]ADB51489.1 hypothetical protein Cwoe_3070 [Conexibacter woesei DSM 14684]
MALAGVVALLAAGAAAAAEPYPVAEPLPDRNPAVHDAYDGEWQVSPPRPNENPYLVPITDYRPALHRLTAIVADSTVNFLDARWLDAKIVISQGTPVIPLVTDGPLWDYSVDGSVLTQANPLFPIDRVLGRDETPDRLIIAQGVNNASPTWHGGWTTWDEWRYGQVVDVAGAGVDCIVVVTPGYKTGPGDPNAQYGPASLAVRANLDAAAAWMRTKAASSSRFVLADWHALSISRPEWWFNNVHPNDAGSDQYEALITRAARQCSDPVGWPAPSAVVSEKLIKAAYADFLGIARVAQADLDYWSGQLARSGYRATPFFGQLTKDDGFSTEVIDGLYRQLLGRAASRDDLIYWRPGVEAQSTTVADLAQGLLASRELSAGTDASGFVDRVYDRVLDRTASRAERDYWVGELGGSSNGTVGRAIFQSAESRVRRAAALGDRYLGRSFNRLEQEYWRTVLATNDGNDVAMAIALAKLPEYLRTAQTR